MSLSPEQLGQLTAGQREVAHKMGLRRVRELRWSDGIVLYAPLWREDGHTPVMAVYEILATTAGLILLQLASGKPVRGGIDVGTGIEADGELFGAGLVKSYQLESKVAGHPRIAVGEDLAEYLTKTSHGDPRDDQTRAEAAVASQLHAMLMRDEDGQRALDYVGEVARHVFYRDAPEELFHQAQGFVTTERRRFQKAGQRKLFERYSRLARYLDTRVHLWSAWS